MSKFLSIMDMIYKKGGGYEKMAEANSILDTMFHKLEKVHKELYDETMHEFEEIAYEITLPEAEKIVKEMKPYGQKWSYEEMKEFLHGKGITEHCIEYFMVMSMMYNDYHKTAEMLQKADDPEFYFSLAKDFITDVDAKPFKVERYFISE